MTEDPKRVVRLKMRKLVVTEAEAEIRFPADISDESIRRWASWEANLPQLNLEWKEPAYTGDRVKYEVVSIKDMEE